jgi:uncharacterized protein YggU (UPF0235/DUF167 family)
MEAGARLRVRVSPAAGKAGIVGRLGDVWRIRVTPAPERGRATEAALRLLAETLSVPRRSVSLVSGHASRDKLVSVAGLTSTEVEHRLASETAEGRRPSR